MRRAVVFVGGPGGAGKTTIVRHLVARFEAATHRPHVAFLAVAANLGIPPEQAFNLDMIHETDVWSTYSRWCQAERLTVADVHYAIQSKRDSAAAIGGDPREELWTWEAYVPAITPEFLIFLKQAGLNLGLILITADPKELVRRLSARDGQRARSRSSECLQREVEAEKSFFTSLVTQADVATLRVENMSPDLRDICAQAERLVERLL